ncbi:UNVERIFIED_CONTAM: 60S ribosomal protein L13a-4 [Sesamum angustifolium]|uniref:60S ribosomal protein L13a-4 n=1 Tax=Sesamum angustifolium TaxID=2727405 RepID=A0AAW2NZU7_9LAMI
MVSGSGICAKRVVVDARHHMLGRLASILAKELLNGQKVVVVRCEEICLSGGLVRQKMKYLRFLRKRMNTKPSHGPIHFRAPSKILWRTIRGYGLNLSSRSFVLFSIRGYDLVLRGVKMTVFFGLVEDDPPQDQARSSCACSFEGYEGIPPPYDKIKRMVIPDALKVLRLQAGHKYCLLGRLSSEVGWNHYDTIRLVDIGCNVGDGFAPCVHAPHEALFINVWYFDWILVLLERHEELEKKRKDRAQATYERKKQLTKLRLKAEKVAEEKLGAQLDIIAPIKY